MEALSPPTMKSAAGEEPHEAILTDTGREPKMVRIQGVEDFAHLSGYYLRIPASAALAYVVG
jgi:hypothetical protein